MKWLRGVVLGVIALVAAAAAVLGWGVADYFAAGPLAKSTTVVVPKGQSVEQIAANLVVAGVIDHPSVFAAAAKITGAAPNLKAGEYEFAAAISPRFTIDLLLSGKVVRHKLTVPEGQTSGEVVVALKAIPILEGAIAIPPPEGSLLPQTYFYIYGEQRQDLITRMTRAMDEAVAKAWAKRQPGLPLANAQQAVILASIIEKETAKPDERARIAGVYIDRLKIGMPLQADPTVAYALTRGGLTPLDHPLGHTDVAKDSPYNTYMFKGFPPTPIANPGVAALEAAVNPEHRGELFFVADGKGGHLFSKTLAEHNRNVAKLRAQKPVKAAGE
jgi:peptidoglycan lytic transglycosylase G